VHLQLEKTSKELVAQAAATEHKHRAEEQKSDEAVRRLRAENRDLRQQVRAHCIDACEAVRFHVMHHCL
jgi:hypothetical protein